MAPVLPQEIDTVVIGNGPSALLLSYILHGNIPVYDIANPHPDSILHDKLKDCVDLLSLDTDYSTEHFSASRFSYSTQALPINVLFDTLVRPFGETDDNERKSCITWKRDLSRAVTHAVMGKVPRAGGQWVDNPVDASWDIGTLSYAGMLALPGPSRREVAEYFAAYPAAVGIDDSVFNHQKVFGISRKDSQFHIASHDIICKHLVLASGVFDELIPPRPLLQPLLNFTPSENVAAGTVLIIGSGFSAADIILSTPPSCKIIHIYKWNPASSPSPLRACHQQAYPEYAGVYRKMKTAALLSNQSKYKRPKTRRSSSTTFGLSRDWLSSYEGLPNTLVNNVQIDGRVGIVTLQNDEGDVFQRTVDRLVYVIGRRGSLEYLDPQLRDEGKANVNLEVASGVFIIGSLTGDSLIRFAYGGCAYAAGKIMGHRSKSTSTSQTVEEDQNVNKNFPISNHDSPNIPAMHGFDGHVRGPGTTILEEDLPLDRRKDTDPNSKCVECIMPQV